MTKITHEDIATFLLDDNLGIRLNQRCKILSLRGLAMEQFDRRIGDVLLSVSTLKHTGVNFATEIEARVLALVKETIPLDDTWQYDDSSFKEWAFRGHTGDKMKKITHSDIVEYLLDDSNTKSLSYRFMDLYRIGIDTHASMLKVIDTTFTPGQCHQDYLMGIVESTIQTNKEYAANMNFTAWVKEELKKYPFKLDLDVV